MIRTRVPLTLEQRERRKRRLRAIEFVATWAGMIAIGSSPLLAFLWFALT